MDATKPILTLIVQVGLILALSRIMGALFSRFRQPQVVGEMVAGIMLGPSLLGKLAPVVQATLFPPDSIMLLHILSELGVVFFLFLIGLEFDPDLIRKRGRAALVISASSIVVPFVLGVGLAHYLAPRVFSEYQRAHFGASALFMGAAISVTAFPVLARIISERNLHKTHVGAISITGAAVNDVLAWCMLAFVVAMAQYDPEHGRMGPVITLGMALGYVGFMFLAVKPSLVRLERVYETRGGLSQNIMAVILLLVLASAYTTERIGIHALFGAFVMGLIMPKGTRFVRELNDKLEDYTVVFMLPIFFAYAGLSTDLRLLLDPGLIWYTLLIVLAASAGKIGGTMLASRVCGISWRESTALGVLMNTRGLMELIILTIGLHLGIINQAVYAMMVVMALVTTGLTTPLLHWVYPAARFGGEEAQAKLSRRRVAFTVLMPVSLPESGRSLARLASTLIGPGAAGGRAVALHLRRAEEMDAYRSGLDDVAAGGGGRPGGAGDEVLGPVLAEAGRLKLSVEPVSFVSMDVADDIASVAHAYGAALVLMGFHKPVIGKTILGGTVHRVLNQCHTDVAILVDRGLEDIRRILVPFMGSPHDRLAMELAGRMARNIAAQVTVLHVVQPDGNRPKLDARGATDRVFADPTQPAPVEFRVVEDASPVEVVLREAPQFDLVIVGIAEQWGLESHLIAWRRERIARECPASMLIVRKYPRRAEATADVVTPAAASTSA